VKKNIKNTILFLSLLFVGSLLIIASVNYFFKVQRQKMADAKQEELSSIANIKVEQIAEWYDDELLDAEIIVDNTHFIQIVKQWILSDGTYSNAEVSLMLSQLAKEHGYHSVTIFSDDLHRQVSSGVVVPHFNDVTLTTLKQCLLSEKTLSTDLFVCELDGDVFIDFVAPLFFPDISRKTMVVFRHDPNKFLFPFVETWPVQSRTSESLLLRNEADSVLFMSNLRHKSGGVMKMKLPLVVNSCVEVNAAMGQEGDMVGQDYRGENVLASLNPVPGTRWVLVTKTDKSELYDNYLFKTATPEVFSVSGILILIVFFYVLYLHRQRKLYKQLYNSQEEYKTILYSIGDAVISTKKDGTIITMNPVAEKLTGWSEQDAKGRKIDDVFIIINEETREKIESPVAKVIRQGVVVGLANHTLLISRSGEEWPISDSGAPIFDSKGNVTGVIMVFRDQTEDRKQQKKTAEIQRKLSTLMSNLPGMAYRCRNDHDWTMDFVSKGCKELTGYSTWEMEGNQIVSYNRIIYPDDRLSVWDSIQEALQNKSPFQIEYRISTKDDHLKWVWERGIGIYDDDGALLAIEGFIADVSDRKSAEISLTASEKLFQTLAENAAVGIFRTDAAGLTTYVNPEWCKITGLSPQDAMGIGWINSVHPDDRLQIIEGWENATNDYNDSDAEYRFVKSNSSVVWVKRRAVPEFSESGKLLGYIGTIVDITEIRNSSEAIQQANLLLRTIIDNIPDAIYLKDIEGRKVIANKADIENCGALSEEELLGKTDFDLFPSEIATSFWEDDDNVLKTGNPILQRVEYLVNFNGKEKWLLTSKIPLLDSDKRTIGLIGIGHDITERKKNEKEMLKLTNAVSQSPVSIVITDLNGIIEYVNPKFVEVTGYSFHEAVGKNSNILKSGLQGQQFYQEMWQTILSGNDWKGDLQNRKKSGELFWESMKISPILNDAGSIISFVAVKEDITEKRRMLAELIEAKVKAEESDRLKSSFLANMSHEIRTPLNSILGFSNFLTSDDTLTQREKQEYSDIITKSADSLLQIINDIIDISSLETGQLKTWVKPVEVGPILRSLFLIFSNKLNEMNKSHLILELQLETDVTVMADENRFIQIVTNLANNAMKFTERGGVRFGIESIEKDHVVFFVSDTGIGIPSNMHQSVFDRFRQVENDRARLFGGNGLGLAIVKNLVELMDGRIWLESEVGKGSIFRFTLPLD